MCLARLLVPCHGLLDVVTCDHGRLRKTAYGVLKKKNVGRKKYRKDGSALCRVRLNSNGDDLI